MKTSLPSPTLAEERRFLRMQQDLGCIVCRLYFRAYRSPDIHHLLVGGVRVSHGFTIPLCPEHHRLPGTAQLGPSLADGSRPFEERWGTQEWLLEATNRLLEAMQAAV